MSKGTCKGGWRKDLGDDGGHRGGPERAQIQASKGRRAAAPLPISSSLSYGAAGAGRALPGCPHPSSAAGGSGSPGLQRLTQRSAERGAARRALVQGPAA